MQYTLSFKTASVVGIGISNRPLIDFLLKHGVSVVARDKKSREALGDIASALEQKGVRLVCGEQYLDDIQEEAVFRAPGVRYDTPGLVRAVENGALLTSEMELFFDLTPAKIIGITGSNGKTTTTTLISLMLEKDHRVYVGGNIGRPLLPLVEEMTSDDIAVVELSSFQLHTMKKSPEIAVVTNLAPNHLDYHRGMEEYIDAKKNIFRHPECRRLITNYDCQLTRALRDDLAPGCSLTYFCAPDDHGVRVKDGVICCCGEPVLPVADIRLPGQCNVENYMAAIGAVQGLCDWSRVREVARSFGGVAHRCQLIRTYRGVRYYNSSIDSSPSRTIAALGCFPDTQPIVLILGGYDKHIPFDVLAEPVCRRAKAVILTGATAQAIGAVLEHYDGHKPVMRYVPDFDDAVRAASAESSDGDVVLFSPACASFDAFRNFEERGERFCAVVRAIE